MENGKISIIVPCHNKEKYLSETLNSVLSQTYQNWECIIVDDGSPDSCYSIGKKYCTKDSRFHVFRQENKGLSAARNAGIHHSDGEYILPLDADDLIASTYLEKAIERFKDVPETKLIYCLARYFGESNDSYTLPPYDYHLLLKQNMIFCAAIYRRCDYNMTVGYNTNMKYGLEDWDFWLSLLNEGDVVYRINEELFFYRKLQSSMTNGTIEHQSEMEIQIFKNHVGKYLNVVSDWIVLNRQLRNLTNELKVTKEELTKTRKSHAFIVGKALISPIAFLKKQNLKTAPTTH